MTEKSLHNCFLKELCLHDELWGYMCATAYDNILFLSMVNKTTIEHEGNLIYERMKNDRTTKQ